MPYWRDSWRRTATYTIPLSRFRKTDANYATDLPAASAAGVLGCSGLTHGTNTPNLYTEQANGNAKTDMGRCEFVLPPEYVAGGAITLRVHARTNPVAAGGGAGTSTLDAQVHKSNREAGAGSDICATGAQSINSATWADKDFTITPTGLVAGDLLDIELTIAVNDTGGGSAAYGFIGAVQVLLLERS